MHSTEYINPECIKRKRSLSPSPSPSPLTESSSRSGNNSSNDEGEAKNATPTRPTKKTKYDPLPLGLASEALDNECSTRYISTPRFTATRIKDFKGRDSWRIILDVSSKSFMATCNDFPERAYWKKALVDAALHWVRYECNYENRPLGFVSLLSFNSLLAFG